MSGLSGEAGPVARSYGCSFACGNPYDYVFVTVADGTTLMLCLPCMVNLASQMVASVVDAENPEVKQILAMDDAGDTVPMSGPGPRQRGRNAPATNDDPDLLEVFDGVVTVDMLPDEFK